VAELLGESWSNPSLGQKGHTLFLVAGCPGIGKTRFAWEFPTVLSRQPELVPLDVRDALDSVISVYCTLGNASHFLEGQEDPEKMLSSRILHSYVSPPFGLGFSGFLRVLQKFTIPTTTQAIELVFQHHVQKNQLQKGAKASFFLTLDEFQHFSKHQKVLSGITRSVGNFISSPRTINGVTVYTNFFLVGSDPAGGKATLSGSSFPSKNITPGFLSLESSLRIADSVFRKNFEKYSCLYVDKKPNEGNKEPIKTLIPQVEFMFADVGGHPRAVEHLILSFAKFEAMAVEHLKAIWDHAFSSFTTVCDLSYGLSETIVAHALTGLPVDRTIKAREGDRDNLTLKEGAIFLFLKMALFSCHFSS